MNNSSARIFTQVEETEALLTSLFQALCRSDQDQWLRKMGLARENLQGLNRSASTRGLANVTALVGASSGSPHSPGHHHHHRRRFEVSTPRVTHALRLSGEDHKPEHESARPREFVVSLEGARGKQGHLRGWFDELAPVEIAKEDAVTPSSPATAARFISLDAAKKEFVKQEHFGVANPENVFERVLGKVPAAKQRGSLTFDEFVVIFSQFEYN